MNADRLPEIVQDWGSIAAKVLAEQLALPTNQADQVGAEIAFLISQEYAGRNLYIPLSTAFKASERDRAIWAAYSAAGGKNLDDLVHQYQLSHVHIRRICKRMRELERRERQQQLF